MSAPKEAAPVGGHAHLGAPAQCLARLRALAQAGLAQSPAGATQRKVAGAFRKAQVDERLRVVRGEVVLVVRLAAPVVAS